MKNASDWIRANILSGKRPYFFISGLVFVVYFPILFFGFSYLDDNNLILDHSSFIGNFWNIFESFRHDVFLSPVGQAYYRPIMNISLILNAQIGGVSPFIYHLTDLFVHILASILIFIFFQKLKYKKDISLLFSLIFAIHPVLSQAVGWIPGRNDTLLAVFVLLAFISLIDFFEKKEKKYLWRYFLWFSLGVFTKETAIMMIPIQFFYLFFIHNSKVLSEFGRKELKSKKMIDQFLDFWKSQRKDINILLAGWVGIVGLFFLLRHAAFTSPIPFSLGNMIKSVFNNSPAFLQFIGKIVFPFNLSTYPIIKDTTFIYGIAATILIFLAVFFNKNKRWNFIGFGLIWFFFFLAPTFVRPNADIIADFIEHRLYLPIIGFLILAMETSWVQKFNYKKIGSVIFAAFVIILFLLITIIHSQNFKNRLAFWNDAVKHSPHAPLAHRNLGAMLFLDGKMDEAKLEFEKSLDLNPEEQMAHNNLGLIYMNRGEYEKSETEYNKEIEVNPTYDNAFANRGILYYKMGRFDDAVGSWKKALEINPGYADAAYNLFAYYYQKQDKENVIYWANFAKDHGIPLLPEMQQIINPIGSILGK